ncbi:(-)-germacrene D synthase [Trifolium repens]|nr:(-)-germacrene D synthase [Trifolium repens]
MYAQDHSHNENLLNLAKLDFNMLQSLHQKEFGNSCKWWKELDVHNGILAVWMIFRITRVSIQSSGYGLVTTTCYLGMRDIATEDIFKWVGSMPKAINAAIVICRLMDDLVSNEFEQKRDHITSFLECYMKKYNVSREAASQEGRKRIADAWKDINEECLRPTEVPMPIMTILLNLSRFMDVVYKDKDNFTHPEGEMKTFIKALLVDPVPI